MPFSFPDSVDIILHVLGEYGINADTQMHVDYAPGGGMEDPALNSLHPENLPFVHVDGMSGDSQLMRPIATHAVQLRVYSGSELTARDAARIVTDLLKAGPQDGGAHGVIDIVQATTPVMVDSGYSGISQFNSMLTCQVRAL